MKMISRALGAVVWCTIGLVLVALIGGAGWMDRHMRDTQP